MSFEEMMEKLEKLIARMEEGELPLAESLQSFEEGMQLIREARTLLDGYQKKIEQTVTECEQP